MRGLANKVAIVSGAGGGIGAACARRLAAEGAIVAVVGQGLDEAEQVAAAITAEGGVAAAFAVDLVSEREIGALFDAVVARFGQVEILINNAADTRAAQLALDQKIADLAADVWDRAFAVNARGTMLMTKHAIPLMIVAGGGAIVNTSSGASIAGDVYNAAYAASKSAVNSLTRYVATQYGKQGIRCNAVLPGLIMTEMARSSLSPRQLRVIERQTLTTEFGAPADVAAVLTFLASDDARFINGQMLCVDGGILMHMPHAADMEDIVSAGRAAAS
jgi:NAD(P)-dependent dehydrogenase (short-subunit alcohol dehydrogenase family)